MLTPQAVDPGHPFPYVSNLSLNLGLMVAPPRKKTADVVGSAKEPRAISFFEIRAGKIVKMIEYWPEPFTSREDRNHLLEQKA